MLYLGRKGFDERFIVLLLSPEFKSLLVRCDAYLKMPALSGILF